LFPCFFCPDPSFFHPLFSRGFVRPTFLRHSFQGPFPLPPFTHEEPACFAADRIPGYTQKRSPSGPRKCPAARAQHLSPIFYLFPLFVRKASEKCLRQVLLPFSGFPFFFFFRRFYLFLFAFPSPPHHPFFFFCIGRARPSPWCPSVHSTNPLRSNGPLLFDRANHPALICRFFTCVLLAFEQLFRCNGMSKERGCLKTHSFPCLLRGGLLSNACFRIPTTVLCTVVTTRLVLHRPRTESARSRPKSPTPPFLERDGSSPNRNQQNQAMFPPASSPCIGVSHNRSCPFRKPLVSTWPTGDPEHPPQRPVFCHGRPFPLPPNFPTEGAPDLPIILASPQYYSPVCRDESSHLKGGLFPVRLPTTHHQPPHTSTLPTDASPGYHASQPISAIGVSVSSSLPLRCYEDISLHSPPPGANPKITPRRTGPSPRRLALCGRLPFP